ncbi:KDO transferase A isoform X4 [Wolffia australiana]
MAPDPNPTPSIFAIFPSKENDPPPFFGQLDPPSASPTGSEESTISSACDSSSESCPSRPQNSCPEEEEEEEDPSEGASINGRRRGVSLEGGSMLRQPEQNSEEPAQSSGSSRGKNIRRLLDPWLKPRKVAAGSAASSLGDVAAVSSRWASVSIPGEKKKQEMKQSLLRLTWKNGFPLLTFSVNETDILAATRKTGVRSSESGYTFYVVQEERMKKAGGWLTSKGKKSKRKELVSSVAGQLTVSCGSLGSSLTEFVLVAPEGEGCEVAAVAVESGGEEEKVAVVLSSEMHGMSNKENGGRPSPLLQRWRSGGSCDCGGWDVGCSLTVLVDRLHEVNGARNSHRVELFFQGGSRDESRPALSLVVFKEGVYTVDFHASIGPLQAFAACVSILHSRSSTGLLKKTRE